ncbi:ribonuclease H-like domain-containing protein [Tanacetum coccineum]
MIRTKSVISSDLQTQADTLKFPSRTSVLLIHPPSNTNEANTTYEVNTANTKDSTASTQVSTTNLSDTTVYAFLASQPNRKFFQKTGRKITINRSDTTGYDKSKVECFNCHKLGHFAREWREPRNQDSRNWNQDSSKRTIKVEDTSSKAMLAIDGAGFDWSYMVDDEVPTNMDPSWIEAMKEELLQFKLQEVWTLVDLPNGKRAIGSKWVFRNKKDERGIVIRNKARQVAQGYTQEEGIDYDEVFAPVARFYGVSNRCKSAFLYGKIE